VNLKAGVLVLAGLLLVSMFVCLSYLPHTGASGENWLTGWTYRKSHIINKATGSGTNYQVCIKVYKGAGTDGNATVNGLPSGTVYCGGLCNDDFGDVRFTDDDGSTALCYWMEDNTLLSANSAVFWVKVADSLESAAQTIYLYYGKSGATTTSDGEHASGIFFDDFNSGSVPNATLWTNVSTPSVASGIVTCAKGQSILGTSTFGPYNYVLHGRYRYESTPALGIGIFGITDNLGSNAVYFYTGETEYIRCLKAGASTLQAISIDTTWHVLDAYWISATNATFWKDGAALGSLITNIPIVALPCGLTSRATYGPTVDADYYFVRKYTTPEPSHDSWGAQEVCSFVIVYFNHNSIDGCRVYLDGVFCTNGTAYNKLAFTILAAENGTSLFMFQNFTYVDWSNASDLNPDTCAISANVTVWAYFCLKPIVLSYAVARFDFSPSNPGNTTLIIFNGSQSYATAAISIFSWNFDDGNTTATGSTDWVSHVFAADGLYNVTLTVTASVTNTSDFTFQLLNVSTSAAAPAVYSYAVARFDFNPSNPAPGQHVVFNASQSYNTTDVAFNWDFGDGNITLVSDSVLVVHSFASNITYVVSLELHGTLTTVNSTMFFRSVNVTTASVGGGLSRTEPEDLAALVIAGFISVIALIAVLVIIRGRRK